MAFPPGEPAFLFMEAHGAVALQFLDRLRTLPGHPELPATNPLPDNMIMSVIRLTDVRGLPTLP